MTSRKIKDEAISDADDEEGFELGLKLFIDRVKTLGITVYTNDYRYRYGNEFPVNPYIFVEWVTGGISGGSCWEESDPQPFSSDTSEPEFTDLDKILEEALPTITFLKYKKLVSEIVEHNYYTTYEYYGNQTDLAYKKVDLKALYSAIIDYQMKE